MEERVDDADRVRALERTPAREKLPEQHAQRKDVRARVDLAAEGLLGRHVRDGPEHGARRGARRVRADRAPGLARPRPATGRNAARPKSRTFTRPALVHHDVPGLDVAVHDAARVRGHERVGDLQDDVHGLRDAPARAPSRSAESVRPATYSIAMKLCFVRRAPPCRCRRRRRCSGG